MSVDGQWDVTVKTPMGLMNAVLTLKAEGGRLTGEQKNQHGVTPLEDGVIEGDRLTWTLRPQQPMPMKFDAEVTVEGDTMKGLVRAGMMGTSTLTGTRKA